jgi:hypothetical protein
MSRLTPRDGPFEPAPQPFGLRVVSSLLGQQHQVRQRFDVLPFQVESLLVTANGLVILPLGLVDNSHETVKICGRAKAGQLFPTGSESLSKPAAVGFLTGASGEIEERRWERVARSAKRRLSGASRYALRAMRLPRLRKGGG